MSRNPQLTDAELTAALGPAGVVIAHIRGSHHFLHADGRHTAMPVHAGETIGPGLFSTDGQTLH